MICPATQSECGCSELNPCLSALPYPEPTPTPSITVGTQVRLTGVVVNSTNEQCWVSVFGAEVGQEGLLIFRDPFDALEVIRQPFKRGEVVYQPTTFKGGEGAVVVADEANGLMLIAVAEADCTVQEVETKYYERRP